MTPSCPAFASAALGQLYGELYSGIPEVRTAFLETGLGPEAVHGDSAMRLLARALMRFEGAKNNLHGALESGGCSRRRNATRWI